MASLHELKDWIDRDIRRRHWRVAIVEEPVGSLVCRVTANKHVFTITANGDDDYLGCSCRTRRLRPGRDHPAFADLPDGRLTAETWQAIVADMKAMEIPPYRGRAL